MTKTDIVHFRMNPLSALLQNRARISHESIVGSRRITVDPILRNLAFLRFNLASIVPQVRIANFACWKHEHHAPVGARHHPLVVGN